MLALKCCNRDVGYRKAISLLSLIQRTLVVIHGTFIVIQGTLVVIQGTLGVIQGSVAYSHRCTRLAPTQPSDGRQQASRSRPQ
jgi:hypothetical protein